MDKFEKQEILDEFLIKWKGGTSTKMIEKDLSEKHNPDDVSTCRKIFEKWVSLQKPWKYVDKIRA